VEKPDLDVAPRQCAGSSPDLAPAEFFLFPKLKTTLKGRRFQTTQEIQENAIRELHTSQKVCSTKHSNNGRNIGNGVLPVEGTTLKGTVLKMCKMSNKVFIAKVRSFLNMPRIYIKEGN
jgi:hypothetical protein